MPTGRAAKVESALAHSEADFVIAEDAETSAAAAPQAAPTAATASPAPRAVATRSVSVAATASTDAEAVAQPAAAAPTALQDSSGPHFALTVAPTVGSGAVATSAAASAGAGQSGGSGQGPIPVAIADIPAKWRAGNVPSYTAAALSAAVEANVPLEIVVNDSGLVTSARVLEPVGYGLDEAARQGVLAYRFTPAVRGGKAVAVRMHWLMRFQLR